MNESKSHRIRVLVVDDHPAVRRGLRDLMETCPDVDIVGEADDGLSALYAAKSLLPDVVLPDVGLPDLSGIEVARQLRGLVPLTRIIMLSSYDIDCVAKVMGNGAHGYLSKSDDAETLAKAIGAVYRGERWMPPSEGTESWSRSALPRWGKGWQTPSMKN